MGRQFNDVSDIFQVFVDGKKCRCVTEIIYDFDRLRKGFRDYGKVKCLMDNERWEYVEGKITIACDLNPLERSDFKFPETATEETKESWIREVTKEHNKDISKTVEEPTEFVRDSNLK